MGNLQTNSKQIIINLTHNTMITTVKNTVKKEAIELSSNLATCLENWENLMRQQNRIFGSRIKRNHFNLIEEVEFFYNDFVTVEEGKQYVKFVHLLLTDID